MTFLSNNYILTNSNSIIKNKKGKLLNHNEVKIKSNNDNIINIHFSQKVSNIIYEYNKDNFFNISIVFFSLSQI